MNIEQMNGWIERVNERTMKEGRHEQSKLDEFINETILRSIMNADGNYDLSKICL